MDATVSRTSSGPLTHRSLGGRYDIGRQLARGGMATVYEALDTRLGRTVAIKVMHPALAGDPDFVARFIREARSAARLSHPNVVAVYDQGADSAGTNGDIVFLAMEYVPGGTLRDLLRQHGRLRPAEALALYEQMLAALASAHKAGLVHRDVKPENVLITDDGRVKVADFGLARAVVSTTSAATTGVVIGTVSYLSPEQVERGVADARSDVYSAGIVLYEMLTGEKPYVGETPMEVAYQHVHSRVPAPSLRAPGLPVALDTIVARATARDPGQRPHDAGELLAHVTRARAGRPLVLPPLPSDAEPTLRRRDVQSGHGTGARYLEEHSDDHSDDEHRGDTIVVPRAPVPEPTATPSRRRRADILPPDARRRRRRGWYLAAAVVLLGAIATVAGYWFAEGRFTLAPAVLGMSVEQASAEVERAGLTPVLSDETEFSERVPPDHVIRTDPEPGARIVSGAEVVLVLSQGPERFVLPDVAGSTLQEAVAALERDTMPLVVADSPKQEFSETVAAGAVIRTEPPTGTPMKRGQTVTLVVSQGRQAFPVPDVRTKPLAEATALLEGAGFGVTSEEVFSTEVDAGLVVAQDKTGDLFRDDVVHLQVSKGPELFAVPRVLGMDTADAERILVEAGFTVNIVRVLPEPLTDDIVIRQTPGGEQPAGTTITLYVI